MKVGSDLFDEGVRAFASGHEDSPRAQGTVPYALPGTQGLATRLRGSQPSKCTLRGVHSGTTHFPRYPPFLYGTVRVLALVLRRIRHAAYHHWLVVFGQVIVVYLVITTGTY
jgi:hypothetical protein